MTCQAWTFLLKRSLWSTNRLAKQQIITLKKTENQYKLQRKTKKNMFSKSPPNLAVNVAIILQ